MIASDMVIEQEQELIRMARDAYSGSSSFFDTTVRSRIIDDILQFNSEHPLGSKYRSEAYRLKSKLFRPKTRTAIRKNEATAAAAYFSSEDVVSVQPIDDSDPVQLAAAALHKELLQFRLTMPRPLGMPWFLTCIGAYQEAQTVGVVCSLQDWLFDEKKGVDRPEVTLVPVENFRFDPAADWRDVAGTSPYFIIEWPMYVKDIKKRMHKPVLESVEVTLEDGSTQLQEQVNWDKNGRPWLYMSDEELKVGMRSADSIRQTREGSGSDSKQASTSISEYDVVWVHQNFVELDGNEVFYYTLGTHKLLSTPEPLRERYPQGMPVVVGFCILEAHRPYKSSLPSLERHVQGEINDVANLRVENVKLRLGKRYFAKRGSQIDLRSLTRNTANSVTLMNDPNNDVKVVTTDDATASSYQEQDRLNLDFDDLAGAFSGSSVQSNRNLNETVGGMNLISENANMVSEYQLRTFTETWVEPVLRQVIELQKFYESDEMVLAVCGRKAKIERQKFTEVTEDLLLQPTLLSVAVGTGSTNPQAQLDRFAFGLGLVGKFLPNMLQQLKGDEVLSELFGKLGYKDGKRFFDGMDDEQGDPRLQQALQMIQQLQQALAQKHPPELLAAQIEKEQAMAREKLASADLKDVQAMAKRVEALYAAMNTAQTAVTVPGVTPVADQIARSAGFVDKDGAEIAQVPAGGQGMPIEQGQPQQNTSPMFPPSAESGMLTGIENGNPGFK